MTNQPRTLDEARRLFPTLGFALYAYAPGLPVTLEVHDDTGTVFTWKAGTEAAAFAQAFPETDEQPPATASDPSQDTAFVELPEIEADEPAPPSVFD
ncbi:hypothetical protein FHR71_001758 [Methylobacterium sp. RAS18]|nr:hypothetical protein [Methylobacterium sp. RAS18]